MKKPVVHPLLRSRQDVGDKKVECPDVDENEDEENEDEYEDEDADRDSNVNEETC